MNAIIIKEQVMVNVNLSTDEIGLAREALARYAKEESSAEAVALETKLADASMDKSALAGDMYYHLGFYNDAEDIVCLKDCTPDGVVAYMKDGMGHFYTDTTNEGVPVRMGRKSGMTSDGAHVVVCDIGCGPTYRDSFIDIYEKA